MQSKGVFIELPAFELKEVDLVCEACQLDKQHQLLFPNERHVSKWLLDVIHLDVWGCWRQGRQCGSASNISDDEEPMYE